MDSDHNPSRAPPMPQPPRRPANAPPPATKEPAKDARKGGRDEELDLAIEEIAPTQNLKEGFTGQER